MTNNLNQLITEHKDFPKKGIVFKDLLPLLQHPDIFTDLINNMSSSEIFKGSDAIIILTEWDQYKNLAWGELLKNTRSPCNVFDTRSIIDRNIFKYLKANLWQIGKGFL